MRPLASRKGQASGVKYKNQVPSSGFGQRKMDCRIITNLISKQKE